MKNLKLPFAFIIAFLIITFSCNQDDDEIIQKKEKSPFDSTITSSVQILLPDEVSIDLSSATLFTLGTNVSVGSDGKASVPIYPDNSEVAFLFDNEGKALLAGFLSDTKSEISTVTTAEVLLYFSVPAFMQDFSLKEDIISDIRSTEGFDTFSNQFEELFKSNPHALSEGAYMTDLKAQLATMATIENVDLNDYTRVLVDSRDAKSGMEIAQAEDKSITLTNFYPRRAQTFIYKKSYKDTEGKEHVINSKISGGDKPDETIKIEAADLKENVKGKKGNFKFLAICGNLVFKEVESAPQPLEIDEEVETSVTYEVAVVGPGRSGAAREMTETEQAKFEELSKKTFILDYFVPIMLDIIGRREAYSQQGGAQDDQLLSLIDPYLKANPSVEKLVLENDFQGAMELYLPSLYQTGGTYGEVFDILTGIYGIISNGGNQAYNFVLTDEQKENAAKVIQILDNTLQLLSYQCLDNRFDASKQVETWEVIVEEGKVSLYPEKMAVTNFANAKPILAKVAAELQEGESLEYEWTTTTQFGGKLYDLDGDRSSGTTLTTSSETIYFISVASNNTLSDGENIEIVSVKVFIKSGNGRSEIGSASMEVNVQKDEFVIKPNRLTVKGNTTVSFYVVHNNDTTTIPNDEKDYKLVWKTSGEYGFLEGQGTTVTTYNTNSIQYTCTDTETEEGIETLSVLIYSKPKDDSQPYQLVNEAEATIRIENEENKKIFYVPISVVSWGPTESGGYTSCGAGTVFLIDSIENAESYTATVIEFSPEVIPNVTGTSKTWYASNTNMLNENGQFEFAYVLATSGSSPTWIGPPDCGRFTANAAARKGLAQVIVTLKDE